MDMRQEMELLFRQACQEHPGLPRFRAALLLGYSTLRPMAYVILAAEAIAALYLAGVVLWLALPPENRELSAVMNQITEELIRRSKEQAPPPRTI